MKRKHRNTSRLTAWERAGKVLDGLSLSAPCFGGIRKAIERALQAHARETLDRYKRRQARK